MPQCEFFIVVNLTLFWWLWQNKKSFQQEEVLEKKVFNALNRFWPFDKSTSTENNPKHFLLRIIYDFWWLSSTQNMVGLQGQKVRKKSGVLELLGHPVKCNTETSSWHHFSWSAPPLTHWCKISIFCSKIHFFNFHFHLSLNFNAKNQIFKNLKIFEQKLVFCRSV